MNENKNITKKKVAVLVTIIALVAFIAGAYLFSGDYEELAESTIPESCNVMVFSVKGYLSTYTPLQPAGEEVDVSSSEEIVDGILLAQDTPNIKAVILSVDSGGGDGVAGEEIAHALKSFDKPSVAVIRGLGASSAYWAATGADKIFASKISDVGSIGITASYLDESNKNAKEGYTYTELSSAKYKNVGDPGRPLTTEEKAIVMADLRKAHNVFVQDVASNRELEISAVEKLANGLTFIGEDALKNGLIDEIGDIITATKYVEEQIGEKAELCWY